MTQPAIVMPMNDPDGTMFAHLEKLTPLLKTIFVKALVGIPATTYHRQPDYMAWLEAEPFFDVFRLDTDPPVGEYFAALYRYAAQKSAPDLLLHLCFIDRLAFALETDYREQMTEDIRSLTVDDVPLVFARTEKAWETHPSNYREIEDMITRTGEMVFGKTLDYAWCHLVATAEQLDAAMGSIDNPSMSMLAEIVLSLQDTMQCKAVDWLAWEDPFILSVDAEELKAQRESSQQETLKRLSYALPMMELIYKAAKAQK